LKEAELTMREDGLEEEQYGKGCNHVNEMGQRRRRNEANEGVLFMSTTRTYLLRVVVRGNGPATIPAKRVCRGGLCGGGKRSAKKGSLLPEN